MKQTDIPAKFNIPFAASAGAGYVRAIPQASQIAITPGAASLETGFPPLNFLDESAGGIPPFGQDMNGIINLATLWNQWQNAGGPVTYDAAFSAAIGGYPKNTILTTAAGGQWWLCLADDNITNPDTGGAGWLLIDLMATAGLAPRPWFLSCISNVVASPPATPSDGDTYLVPVGAITGWTGKDNLVAVWSAAIAAWLYVNYPTQSMVGLANLKTFYQRRSDGTWASIYASVDSNAFFLGMM